MDDKRVSIILLEHGVAAIVDFLETKDEEMSQLLEANRKVDNENGTMTIKMTELEKENKMLREDNA